MSSRTARCASDDSRKVRDAAWDDARERGRRVRVRILGAGSGGAGGCEATGFCEAEEQ